MGDSVIKYIPRYVFRWRVFWLLVFLFVCSSIYFPSLGDRLINFMSAQNPPFARLPDNARPDFETTVTYKKEKLTIVRTNLKNVVMITLRDLGLKEAKSKKLVSISASMPVSASVEKISVPEDTRAPQNDLEIIRDNIVDAFKAYFDMLTVRIVTIDNKPVMIGDGGEIVPYDKTDRILQWAKEIEFAAGKYDTDPAIIAAIIEQESGGNPSAVSRAGAVGLMQLMPGTARGLGVDPYDPVQNIDGGTRYFLHQYRTFGSVELALAAYNSGPNNVKNGNYLYFSETQGYITNVPRLIEKYRELFNSPRIKN
ncbi:MAG: hypothetical protein CVU89_13190 [Firmicutes bacterium HGW-Firmicutes-14]|nr:MAG: hypothetical protein CVU89_13190 [Firmicutes bacterium HGW-Firmicutes-14]